MILLIDGDFIPWVVSYNCREASYPYEIERSTDELMTSLMSRAGSTSVIGYLGLPGIKSFRYKVASLRPYKGKRGEKPEYFEMWAGVVTSHLKSRYGFVCSDLYSTDPDSGVSLAYETDDMVASHARLLREDNTPHIICSTDKDLKQIPGTHLNPTKMEFLEVDPTEAQASLWLQALMGDSVDNIPGLPKCGPVSAQKILGINKASVVSPSEIGIHEGSPIEYPYRALKAYIDCYGELNGVKNFNENYQLVKLVDTVLIIAGAGYVQDDLTL